MECFKQFLCELPPQCRSELLQYHVAGKTYQQIADELSTSPSSVERHVHQAVKMLKARIVWF